MSKKFTPKFLYRDGNFIRNQQKFYEENIPDLNDCLVEVQKLFDKELTIVEKSEILRFGWSKVIGMFRSNSQFPNAKIKTLLELHGKDGDEAEKALNKQSSKFRDDVYIVSKTGVEISDKYLKDLEERGNYYTKNQAQNQKLQIIENLSKELNKAIDNKIIHKWQIKDIIKSTGRLLSYGITTSDNEGFGVNYEKIRKF